MKSTLRSNLAEVDDQLGLEIVEGMLERTTFARGA